MLEDESLALRGYKKSIKKSWIILGILFLLLIFFSILNVSLGGSNINFVDTIKAFFGQGDPDNIITIWEIRMPVVITAIIVGAGLSLSGAIMQTCLRNPLASPSTIGVGSAATFGANIVIIGAGAASTAVVAPNPFAITIVAFLFAMIAVALIIGISKFQNFSPESIVLAGSALSALFAAGTAILQYFAEADKVASAVFWTFGNIEKLSNTEIIVIASVLAVCFVIFMIQSWNYNAIVTGEETAKSLGVKINVIRIIGLVLSTFLTAVIVSFVGMIGFVGLVGPHIMKRIIGNDHRFFIPASTMAGAIIILVADLFSRVIFDPVSLPIGAITSIIGAIVFVIILMKGLRKR